MARQRTVASRRDRRLRPAADDAPVGRDDVLHRLRQAVDGAADGHGLTVLLTGEAGIGKTTLLRAAARYAEGTGARPAWGSGWPGAGAPGYWPWIQVLRSLGLDDQLSRETGGTVADDAPASARFQLFDDVTSLGKLIEEGAKAGDKAGLEKHIADYGDYLSNLRITYE